MYSDLLGSSGIDYKTKPPHRVSKKEEQGDVKTRSGTAEHHAKGIKQDNLRSTLDNHSYDPNLNREPEAGQTPEKVDFKTITGK